IAGGRAFTMLPDLVTLPAAGSGQERYDLLTLSADGAVNVTSGDAHAPPLDETDKPIPPDREIPLAYVLVDDGGVIEDDDIEQAWTLALFGYQGSFGLTATLGCGPLATVDNAVQPITGTVEVELTASETNYVWIQATGGVAATTSPYVPPGGARGLLLYEIDTDGSGVVAVRDRRRFSGVELRQVEFRWDGEAVVEEWRYATFHGPREGQILPVRGVLASCGDIGDGSTGELAFEVEVEREGVWESLFPDQSTWPVIENGATELTTDSAVPETWTIPAGARIRAQPETFPSGGSDDPTDLTLSLLVVV